MCLFKSVDHLKNCGVGFLTEFQEFADLKETARALAAVWLSGLSASL